MTCSKSDPDSAQVAAGILKKGLVAVLPTDTVYGFSSLADCPGLSPLDTASKIRKIKGRDENKPFICLVSAPDDILNFTVEPVPDSIKKLWPGPLTVIAGAKGGGSIAFRCPGDIWLRNVIGMCGRPVYSTSVNRSGKPVLTSISEIKEEFGDEVDLIVDAGDCPSSVPSTIVRVENGEITVVRKGAVEI